MAINLGTSTSSIASAYPSQRKILKTTLGKLVLFAYLGSGAENRIQYKTSIDNGDTWSSWIDTVFGYDLGINFNFDIEIDISNNIHITAGRDNDAGYYQKLTYVSETQTWNNGSVISLGTNRFRPTLLILSNGNIWRIGIKSTSTLNPSDYSIDNGANWISGGSIDSTSGRNSHKAIEVNSSIWWIYQRANGLYYKIYTDSWGDEQTIVTSNITDGEIGVCKISDNEIYLIVRTSSGIKVFKYNGVSWDGGILLSDNSNDNNPNIVIINGNPIAIWQDYDGTNYNIVYRIWNDSIWEAQVFLTDDVDIDNYPNALEFNLANLYIVWTTGSASPYTIYFDKINLIPSITKTILSDANIFGTVQKTITSDAEIYSPRKYIYSDAFIVTNTKQETILSDSLIVDEVIKDINNKVNFSKRIYYNILNDVRFVKQIIKNINHTVSFVKSMIYNVNHKIVTKKQPIYNIRNDVRFVKSWQKAGEFGFQSLGKEYIKVYINEVEQTDVDIDSMKITKELNTSHTVSFELARAYDAIKPAIESEVIIKYNNWKLYEGYIVNINPTDDPEHIQIECKDEYWKQNRINSYVLVGQLPVSSKVIYRYTVYDYLKYVLGWDVNIGKFVPEPIDCWGQGTSDVVGTLVQECGNFGFYYDENGDKKLWEAGNGDIINLQKQQIGINLRLFQIISQEFDENVDEIVNRYRVQMGERIIKKYNPNTKTKEEEIEEKKVITVYPTPAWNSSYEVLAINSENGFGFDYADVENESNYKEVYTKYNISGLDSEIETWDNEKEPTVEITDFLFGWDVFNKPKNVGTELFPKYILTEGFTIDYKQGILTLNEQIYLYKTNKYGECISTKAPTFRLRLYKKIRHSYTDNIEDNPEVTISNPLMFFTSKIGDYPITITKSLSLSNLSVQQGGSYYDYNTNTYINYPSWNDIPYALDYANWQLSKICDKRITGTVELTLDAVCFYGIDLTKRIFIAGVTESPMNIVSMSYNFNNFVVKLELENSRAYKRTASISYRGN